MELLIFMLIGFETGISISLVYIRCVCGGGGGGGRGRGGASFRLDLIQRLPCACAKYHPGVCSSFVHSVVSNDSVSGQWPSSESLIWAFAVRTLREVTFLLGWLN